MHKKLDEWDFMCIFNGLNLLIDDINYAAKNIPEKDTKLIAKRIAFLMSAKNVESTQQKINKIWGEFKTQQNDTKEDDKC